MNILFILFIFYFLFYNYYEIFFQFLIKMIGFNVNIDMLYSTNYNNFKSEYTKVIEYFNLTSQIDSVWEYIVKTLKIQLKHAQEENALLNEKIAILENTIDKLKALNYIQEKYNIPGN